MAGIVAGLAFAMAAAVAEENLLTIDNGSVRIGIDRAKGGSITWLSWRGYPQNAVNIADPGRLIQQSYYAGKSLERIAEGQSKAWSPWTWNPIQGGGVGSWARVTHFERAESNTLYSVTVPKLWDMANEEAQASMRQWTAFEVEPFDGLNAAPQALALRGAGGAEQLDREAAFFDLINLTLPALADKPRQSVAATFKVGDDLAASG